MASLSYILNPEPNQLSSTTTELGSATPVTQSAAVTAKPASMMPNSSQSVLNSNFRVTTSFEPYEFAEPMPGITQAQQQELQQQHARFALTTHGGGLIRDEGFSVSWSSNSILEKLGRTSLPVYYYQFLPPGSVKDPIGVMWDCEIGMVRVGRIISQLDSGSKGLPKICVAKNPGLESVTMSFTGGRTGNLGGQGYWMPFDCAKAMCTTFCYKFRWALTPIFGYDFVHECLDPDHESYESYVIDRSVTAAARTWFESLYAAAAASQNDRSPATPGKKSKKKSPKTESVATSRPRRAISKQVTPAQDREQAGQSPAENHSDQLVGKKRPRDGADSEEARPQADRGPPLTTREAAEALLALLRGHW